MRRYYCGQRFNHTVSLLYYHPWFACQPCIAEQLTLASPIYFIQKIQKIYIPCKRAPYLRVLWPINTIPFSSNLGFDELMLALGNNQEIPLRMDHVNVAVCISTTTSGSLYNHTRFTLAVTVVFSTTGMLIVPNPCATATTIALCDFMNCGSIFTGSSEYKRSIWFLPVSDSTLLRRLYFS